MYRLDGGGFFILLQRDLAPLAGKKSSMPDCPECGAPEAACCERFNEMLTFEFTDPAYGAVHHLTVATFMLQHSSRLTREGWLYERDLLKQFVVENKLPAFVRRQNRAMVDSRRRTFRIKSKDGHPLIDRTQWTKTILDVRREDALRYCADVIDWARATLTAAETVEPA